MTSFASFTATTKVQQKVAQSKLGEFARKQKKLKSTKSWDFFLDKKGKGGKTRSMHMFQKFKLE